MLARVDALRGAGAAADACVGGTFHAVGWQLVRAHAAALGPAGGADRARRRRRRRPDRPRARGAGRGHDAAAGAPRKRTLLDIYSRTVNAQRPLSRGRRRGVPVVRRARRRHRRAVPRVHGAQARARRCSTSTTCCSTGVRSRLHDDGRRRSSPRASTTCSSTSTRTSTACRRTSSRRCVREHRELTVRRRRPAGDLRLPRPRAPSTCSPSASASRRRAGHAGAELPLHAADPRRRRTSPRRRRRAATRARCARRAGRRAAGARVVRRRGAPGRRRRPTGCSRAREAGVELQRQAVLMRAAHALHAAGARADPPRDPVREVRRPALPRGRAREGLPRRCCAWSPTRATS